MENLTPEIKQNIVKAYLESDPTPDTSVELVKELAEKFERTPNSIRMILTKEDVYVKKEPVKKATTEGGGGTRVSKSDSLQALKDVLSAQGLKVDVEIIDKMTGKAAIYFTEILKSLDD